MRSDRNRTCRCFLALFLALTVAFCPLSALAADADSVFAEIFEGDFSVCPDGWSLIAGQAERTTEHAASGDASLLLTDRSTSASASVASPVIPLEAGVYYRITADVMNRSGNGSLFVYLLDANGKQTDTVSTTVTETGRWSTAELTVCLPKGATSIRILLYSGMANKGETCYDNVRVMRSDGESEQVIHPFAQLTDSYPRLYVTDAAALRAVAADPTAGLAGYTGKETADALIAEASALLSQSSFSMTYYGSTTKTFAIPFREQHFSSAPAGFGSGNYPYWQEMGNRMMEMMQSLSLAYVLTEDTRYGDRAIELALSLAAWSSWTEYPSVNRTSLETGYFVLGTAAVYDLCHDRLTETARKTLATALVEKGLRLLFDNLSAFTDHNYYVNKASALMTGALVLLGAEEDAPKYLSRAYDFAAWYLDRRAESEGQEGLSYTSYAVDLLMSALDSLARVTGNDTLLSHGYLSSLILWAVSVSERTNGTAPPISDAYTERGFFVTASVMRENEVSALAGWYLAEGGAAEASSFLRLVYHRKSGAVETPDAYSARTGIDLRAGVAEAAGWGYLRSGEGADELLLVAVGNNSSQGHSHYDQNSFVLSVGGEWILSDPGYQDYGSGARRDYTLAWGHSNITADGSTQSIKGGGRMLCTLNAVSCAVLTSDASGAYTDPSLTKAERTYLMLRSGGCSYYVLADDLSSETAHGYEWNLNASGAVGVKCYQDGGFDALKVDGARMTGREFFAVGTRRAVRVAFDRDLIFSYRACGGSSSEGVIVASDGTRATDGSFLAVISAMDGKSISSSTLGQGVTVVETYTNAAQNGVMTLHGDLNDVILVARGGKSLSGGGLTATAGTATLLGVDRDGGWTGYAATDATALSYAGRELLAADGAVSVSVSFDGTAGLLRGAVGTTVRLYAPGGIGGVAADAQGYCTLTLTEEATVLSVCATDAEPSVGETDSDIGATPPSGCRSSITVTAPLLGLALCLPMLCKRRGTDESI